MGDNFYSSGVRTVADPRFTATFEHVYTSPALKAATWYMIAGNHDHLFNVSAQIAYTNISPRWHFPDFFYTKGDKKGVLFVHMWLLSIFFWKLRLTSFIVIPSYRFERESIS